MSHLIFQILPLQRCKDVSISNHYRHAGWHRRKFKQRRPTFISAFLGEPKNATFRKMNRWFYPQWGQHQNCTDDSFKRFCFCCESCHFIGKDGGHIHGEKTNQPCFSFRCALLPPLLRLQTAIALLTPFLKHGWGFFPLCNMQPSRM